MTEVRDPAKGPQTGEGGGGRDKARR
jgi:hypothetical protein